MCICGISIILQMAVVNCYHIYPLREIPGWLKRVQICMSHAMRCPCISHKNDVCPNSGDVGHADKPVGKTVEDKSANIPHIEGDETKTEPPTVERNDLVAINVISEKIRKDEEEENLRLEWMELARIFDRLLLLTFATIHIFMILFIFVIMPQTWDDSLFTWRHS